MRAGTHTLVYDFLPLRLDDAPPAWDVAAVVRVRLLLRREALATSLDGGVLLPWFDGSSGMARPPSLMFQPWGMRMPGGTRTRCSASTLLLFAIYARVCGRERRVEEARGLDGVRGDGARCGY